MWKSFHRLFSIEPVASALILSLLLLFSTTTLILLIMYIKIARHCKRSMESLHPLAMEQKSFFDRQLAHTNSSYELKSFTDRESTSTRERLYPAVNPFLTPCQSHVDSIESSAELDFKVFNPKRWNQEHKLIFSRIHYRAHSMEIQTTPVRPAKDRSASSTPVKRTDDWEKQLKELNQLASREFE